MMLKRIIIGCFLILWVVFTPVFAQKGKVYRELRGLGYLSYVDQEMQKEVKRVVKEKYSESKGFASALGPNGESIDHRYFVVHPRRWMDFGGPELLLDQVKAAFRVRGLAFDWRYTIDDTDSDKVIFQVRVNGNEYRIVQGKLNNRHVHLSNQASFYQMVQKELVAQGSPDRLYALGKGEESVFMLLTPALYTYLMETYYHDPNIPATEKPWILGTWAEVIGLVRAE